ncbi:uncharacterized protein GIQ15_06144 [Arthroderma uncinatum]|uniref:uncharacterized protein n=1 Tax=Arthroderma uncinatum TaxID=74035 RepID=UPI00144A9865|nr:uncharacterized protein GIQ15_06144 [Arthroderma uncinatum]KAF3480797.1 hypothetical protein GIQ15_06144 [Arthroderma uncinatum]
MKSKWTAESLLSHLSYGYYTQDQETVAVSIRNSVEQPSLLPREQDSEYDTSTSSLGSLDHLSLELLHLICEKLDVQSLVRLSQTSLRARAVVGSFPVYQVLLKHARAALTNLADTRLLSFHPATTIYSALVSSECISCKKSGAFFFLLTCRRVCFQCLRINPALWVIPVKFARKCFKLDDSLTFPPPGMPVMYIGSRQRPVGFVSAKCARQFSLSVHGSMEEVHRLQAADGMHASTLMEGYFMQFLRDAPLQPFTPVMLSSTGWWEEISEFYVVLAQDLPANRGCLVFPPWSVADGTVADGLWCRGCSRMVPLYRHGKLSYAVLSNIMPDLPPDGIETVEALYERASCARSKEQFWKHVATCWGTREDMPDIEQVMRQLHLYE